MRDLILQFKKGLLFGAGFVSVIFTTSLVAIALTGTLKDWVNNEKLTAFDLNSNFNILKMTIESIPDMRGDGIAGYLSDGTPFYRTIIQIDCAQWSTNSDGFRFHPHGIPGNIVTSGKLLGNYLNRKMNINTAIYTSLPSIVHMGGSFNDGLYPAVPEGASIGDTNLYIAPFGCDGSDPPNWAGKLVIDYM